MVLVLVFLVMAVFPVFPQEGGLQQKNILDPVDPPFGWKVVPVLPEQESSLHQEGDLGPPVGGWRFLKVWCSWFDTTNSSFYFEEKDGDKYMVLDFYAGTEHDTFTNTNSVTLNALKDFWEFNYQTPDTFVFELNLFEIVGNVRGVVITIGIQDSSSFSFGPVSVLNLEPGWQKVKIDWRSVLIPVFGRFYLNVMFYTHDSCYTGGKVGMKYFGGIDSLGGVVHYDTFGNPPPVGIDISQEDNVKEFNLSQNYPNPFNPYTTIKYSIPRQGLVNIKIYDILGNEVATLVNEEKVAGNYEVKFDASKLSSGTYFYRTQVGDFIQNKKMLLLK
jgi:hypothetical protein